MSKDFLRNKTILVTGGTGSFGQKFAQVLYHQFKPKAIRVFSRGEFLQHQMAQKFHPDRKGKMRFLIGDVRDRERLYRAMHGVDIVVHAAAIKQIVTAEYNPIEAVKTNILGAINVIDAAIDNRVKKVMLISTDKAANPINLYGATKLCAEKLFIQGNAYSGGAETKFSCVRYGNVAGSRGSVIPLFLQQGEKGTLTITDERMTRFWITLDQGVRFVIDSFEQMHGGEIFIPKLPSVRIMDIAKAIAPKAKIMCIGMRPGEKLHEVLLPKEDATHAREFPSSFIVEPQHPFWNANNHRRGRKLPDVFEYMSNNNGHWLSIKDIKDALTHLKLEV